MASEFCIRIDLPYPDSKSSVYLSGKNPQLGRGLLCPISPPPESLYPGTDYPLIFKTIMVKSS